MKYCLTALLLFLTLNIFLPVCYSSEENMALWKAVTITAQPNKPFEEVKVSVEVEIVGISQRFKKFKIFHGNKELIIPNEALEILKSPVLHTIEVSSEAGYDKDPWLYVSIVLSSPKPGIEWDYPRVYFAFQNNKFVKRFTTKNAKGGGRVFVDEWKP